MKCIPRMTATLIKQEIEKDEYKAWGKMDWKKVDREFKTGYNWIGWTLDVNSFLNHLEKKSQLIDFYNYYRECRDKKITLWWLIKRVFQLKIPIHKK